MQKSERRAMLRGYLLGALATMVVATLTGGTAVSADGGDETLIHACLLASPPGEANARFVDADEECPIDSIPLHWPAGAEQLGEVLQGNTPEPEEIPPPPAKVRKKLYKPLGVKTNKTTIVKETIGPDPVSFTRSLTVSCPPSHPFMLWGGSQAIPVPPRTFNSVVVSSAPVGWHGWSVTRNTYGYGQYTQPVPITWTLQVTLECSKFAKPKQKVA